MLIVLDKRRGSNMERESYRYTIIFREWDYPLSRRFTTDVTIASKDPITDLEDIAKERFYLRFKGVELDIIEEWYDEMGENHENQ